MIKLKQPMRLAWLGFGLSIPALLCALTIHHQKIAPHDNFMPSRDAIADALQWQPDLQNPCDLCKGAYLTDPSIESVLNPPKFDQTPSVITARGQSTLLPHDRSILRDHVVLIQKGRKITADKAYVYRDQHTGKLTRVELFGHVHDLSAQGLVVSPYANIDLTNQTGSFLHAIARHHYTSKVDGSIVHSWSTATHVHRLSNGSVMLDNHVQMSDCSPLDPTWVIHATHGFLNHPKKRMKAYNTYITFHHIPILYTPYLSFSLDKTRKSGLLIPELGYSSVNGFKFLQPYYWNIAPNADDLVMLGTYNKRGMDLNNRFRWLTHWMSGVIRFNWLPNDAIFSSEKQSLLAVLKNATGGLPYYEALKNTSNHRYAVHVNTQMHLSHHWSSKVQINRVSDDYYLQDLNSLNQIGAVAPNQLFNMASINYHGDETSGAVFAEGYQTLHIYNTPAASQYQRFEGDYNFFIPGIFQKLTLSAQTSAVNFLMPNDYFAVKQSPLNKIVNGTRLHTRVNLAMPMMFASGYVTPSIGWDGTSYQNSYEDPKTIPPTQSTPVGLPPTKLTRAVPVVNIDSGLYFENKGLFGHPDLASTLKPELSYLYIPYRNQQNIPIFDTILTPLTYDTLFSTNRFSGFDRIENANQFNMGVETTFHSDNTGFSYLTLGVGAQYYITPQKVQITYLSNPGPFRQYHFSPLVSELTWSPNAALSTKVDWNWNMYDKQTQSATLSESYHLGSRASLLAEYTYLGGQSVVPPYTDQSVSNVYTLGMTAPIGPRYQLLTYANYDAQNQRMLGGLAGMQYDSCCWALRVIMTHNWSHKNMINQKDIYDNGVYFQFILKGLSSFGTNLNDLLKTDINGYNYV